jgi:phosphoribosylamine--glycine ligase
LVVGSGGREHAIAWAVSKSPRCGEVYVAPGNGGTYPRNIAVPSNDLENLARFARSHNCFTIVGPEIPISLGIGDYFDSQGLPIFSPTRKQAMIETSKAYAKKFMNENHIPTAEFEIFGETGKAIDYARRMGGNVAVKADGLAAGKGVIVCSSESDSDNAIKAILEDRIFGNSGESIVVEERLSGREVSFFALCDGKRAVFFSTATDHKRLFDGDKGPNTGGTGAYSPSLGISENLTREIVSRIMTPVVEKTGYRGFLFAGLMLTEEGPKVLEYNARLGDPETQAILPRLESDFLDLIESPEQVEQVKWSPAYSCCVLLCAKGYPEKPLVGDEIVGLDKITESNNLRIFHSSTRRNEGKLLTSGGRVLGITALGPSLPSASSKAYENVPLVGWKNEHHRTDIGVAK